MERFGHRSDRHLWHDVKLAVESLATALSLTPMLPPGFDRRIEVDADRIALELTPTHTGLLDDRHAGWCRFLAQGERSGLEGIAGGVSARASVDDVRADADHVRVELTLDPNRAPAPEPEMIALNRIGLVAGWTFELEARA